MFYGVLKSLSSSQQTEKQLRKHNQDLRGQQQIEAALYIGVAFAVEAT